MGRLSHRINHMLRHCIAYISTISNRNISNAIFPAINFQKFQINGREPPSLFVSVPAGKSPPLSPALLKLSRASFNLLCSCLPPVSAACSTSDANLSASERR